MRNRNDLLEELKLRKGLPELWQTLIENTQGNHTPHAELKFYLYDISESLRLLIDSIWEVDNTP